MSLNYRSFFPVKCGRCYRVGETQRVEPDPQIGYLYLIKSPETSEYVLSWEPLDGDIAPTQSADQIWKIMSGESSVQLKKIPEQEAFVLLMGPGIPPRFFWITSKEVAQVESACKAFADIIRIPPISPPADFGFVIDESPSAKATRALLQASASFQAPIDPSNPVNRPAPVSSTLDPWLPIPEGLELSQILQPKFLLPVLSDPGVLDRIIPLLPSELNLSTPEEVIKILRSPQFSRALETFDTGLKYGDLGQVTSQLGLDMLAGRGTANFIAAIQKSVDQEVEEEIENNSEFME